LATATGFYPAAKSDINDKPQGDSGNNFGRLARSKLLDNFVHQTLEQRLMGIPAWAWQRFLGAFVEGATEAAARLLQAWLEERPDLPIQWIVGDSAYDTAGFREYARARALTSSPPTTGRRANCLLTTPRNEQQPNANAGIERVFARLKDWRAVATCYCRSTATYAATHPRYRRPKRAALGVCLEHLLRGA